MVLDINRIQVEFGKEGYAPGQSYFEQEYFSLVHDVVVLFMFSLFFDWTRVGSKLCYR